MRRRKEKDTEAEVNVTPMLDVVFILLIFFIVSATFIRESGIDVTRPNEEVPPTKSQVILVQINGQNEIYVERRVVDNKAVRANIERLRAENPKSTVVVQTEREANTGVLVSVIDQVILAGARVSIAPLDS